MTSFDALKKNKDSSLEKLKDQLDKMGSKSYADPDEDKYWSIKKDATGNGYAVIRFLQSPEGEDDNFVRYTTYGFKGPSGQWYIERSRTSMGEKDPVAEYNSKLWNSGIESDKEKTFRAKKLFVSNIYVVRDQANPENEGKVFLYRYGPKIFDKIKDLLKPDFEDETPIDPFNLWDGANFKLKLRQVESYPNYDKSEFDTSSPLADNDDEIEKIWKQCHSLQDVVTKKHYKTYEELEAKFMKVMGTTSTNLSKTADEEQSDELDMSKLGNKTQEPKSSKVSEAKQEKVVEDEDDDEEFFRNLAKR